TIRSTLELCTAPAGLDRSRFEVLVAKEDTTLHKPEPEPLLLALDQLGADPADTVYVGDSPFDLRAAHAAGTTAAAAMWGGIFDRAELLAERPAVWADTCARAARRAEGRRRGFESPADVLAGEAAA